MLDIFLKCLVKVLCKAFEFLCNFDRFSSHKPCIYGEDIDRIH